MNKIYTFSTKEFKPVSFKDYYLYENYGLIVQLLRANKIAATDIARFSMPELKGGVLVDWYADKKGEFQSLEKFDHKVQVGIIEDFNGWKSRMLVFAKKLKANSSPESLEWFHIIFITFFISI